MMTLVLDAGYQPHRIVDWKRAVVMLMNGKAELVEEYDEEVYRSTTIIIKMPAVVRLIQLLTRKRGVKFSRINVATRDKFRCQYCGDKKPISKLNYDHVIPRSRGGKTCWENIVMACYACNSRKADRTPEQSGMKLLQLPVRPKSLPIVAFRMESFSSVPEAWANYVYWQGELETG